MAKTRMGGTIPRQGRTFPETKPRPSEVQIIRLGEQFIFTVRIPRDLIPSLLISADDVYAGDDWFGLKIEHGPEISNEEYEQVVMASLYATWEVLISGECVHGAVLPSITIGDPRDMLPKLENTL